MEKEIFSPMAIDALGEMMNISLGSSATAVSNMLDQRVDITTPKVSVIHIDDFQLGNLDPALGVEIKYVEGLDGSNIMLLKRSDVKVIVDILMGTEMPDEEFELNDLTISAVCELMNQMMGAAATAMSDFLGYTVNISTPEPFELEDLETFKQQHLPHDNDDHIVVVRFKLKIEDALESEFMNVMSVPLARVLLAGLGLSEEDGATSASQAPAQAPAQAPPPPPAPAPAEDAGSGGKMSQEEIEKMMAGMAGGGAAETPAPPPPAPAPAEDAGSGGGKMSQEEIEKMMAGMAGGGAAETPAPPPPPAPTPAAPPPPPPQPAPAVPTNPPQQQAPVAPSAQPDPAVPGYASPAGQFPYGYGYPPMYYQPPVPQSKVVNSQPLPMQQLDVSEALGKEQAQNLDLILEVPLQVTVEIGRTQRKVQDILEFSKGSLVVLDKLAGDQVDLLVNGKCIARGDVVVIEDNFGIRITEIMQDAGIKELVQK
jgi:flagellar motor switch protein FliN/FliY